MDEFRYNRKDFGLFTIHQEFIFKILGLLVARKTSTQRINVFCPLWRSMLLVMEFWRKGERVKLRCGGMEEFWMDTISASAFQNTTLIIVGTTSGQRAQKNEEPGFQRAACDDLSEGAGCVLPKYNRINVKTYQGS
ncbi:hypothetical protein OS493_040392 [Desmophyllum pertusum]|uniref:Uncharacterized protein n=1 Tax=Desmophyllum pertusum TaxID=174260 RepID=A0A9W9YWX2_9CNID|nr:hypothetical protein OS493_040392 [Desmophyllum pertusum]